MKYKIYIIISITIFSIINFWNCKKDEEIVIEGDIPIAEFDVCQSSIAENEKISFVNKSSETAESWSWDFGDGNTSTKENPEHKYETEGLYTVSLVAKNGYGSDKETKKDLITVVKIKTPPEANFVVDNTIVSKNMTIKFSDMSINSPSTWLWDFGDGNTSVFETPFHTYQNEGVYTVKLTVSNEFGTDVKVKTNLIKVYGDTPNVTDYDGNVYNSVQIGTQIWLKQNIKTTHYADGTPILNVTDNTEWMNLNTNEKALCYYNNQTSNKNIYGALYTHAAATNGELFDGVNHIQGICPNGWHISSEAEWKQLFDYLGSDQLNKIKEEGTVHWDEDDYSSGGNNLTGFTALPAGARNASDGNFADLGMCSYWWLANEIDATGGKNVFMFYSVFYGDVPEIRNFHKGMGFSVRCIKD